MSEDNTLNHNPAPDPQVEEDLDYNQTLAYTQKYRRWAIGELTQKGLPTDPKDTTLMLKALKDMDSTALTDRRNNIDQDTADSSREVAEAMKTFIGMQENADPFRRGSDGKTPPAPALEPERLGEQQVVHGETEVGVINESSKDFMRRMEKDED